MGNVIEELNISKSELDGNILEDFQDCLPEKELLQEDKENYILFLADFEKQYCKFPDDTNILNNMWLLEAALRNYDMATFYIKRLIKFTPNSKLYTSLGELYIRQNIFNKAIESLNTALISDGNDFNTCFLLAYALKKNNQLDESIDAYKKTLEINPNSPEIYHNLGNLYSLCKNDPISAIYCYRKYLKSKRNSVAAKSSLGSLYLKAKKYTKGWKYYNYSVVQSMTYCHHVLKDVLNMDNFWQGNDIKDKTLFVYFNGGLGDTIMFARFLPLLQEKCKKVLFAPQSSLIGLFKNSNLGVEMLDANFTKEDLKFDYFLPMMSLAYALKMNSESMFPSPQGYLKSNKTLVQHYKEKYFNNDKFKIGIKWQGNMRYAHERHFDIEHYYKLLWTPNTQFYSLQKGSGIEQLERIKGYDMVDLGSTFGDFADTAAAVENLDLVISNDTSVAHLAGALGKECLVLLPFIQEWRWSTDLSYCPWYKSVKLFKQTKPDDWDGVFDEVSIYLNDKLSSLNA